MKTLNLELVFEDTTEDLSIKITVRKGGEVDIKTFEGSLLSKLLFNNLHENDLVRMCYEYNHGKKDEGKTFCI